ASSPSFDAPTSSPSASCTRAGSTASCAVTASATDTVVSFTAVPPSICGGSPRTLPTRADAAGGTAVKFYELRDNLAKAAGFEPKETCMINARRSQRQLAEEKNTRRREEMQREVADGRLVIRRM